MSLCLLIQSFCNPYQLRSHNSACSLSSLTKLAVLGAPRGKSIVSVPIAYLPSTLLDLELERVILDFGWPLFLAPLTRLTQLKMTNCLVLESSSQEAVHMAPISSLKWASSMCKTAFVEFQMSSARSNLTYRRKTLSNIVWHCVPPRNLKLELQAGILWLSYVLPCMSIVFVLLEEGNLSWKFDAGPWNFTIQVHAC